MCVPCMDLQNPNQVCSMVDLAIAMQDVKELRERRVCSPGTHCIILPSLQSADPSLATKYSSWQVLSSCYTLGEFHVILQALQLGLMGV